jgi:hypothetical protein
MMGLPLVGHLPMQKTDMSKANSKNAVQKHEYCAMRHQKNL